MRWKIKGTRFNVISSEPVSPQDKLKLHFDILLEKENKEFPQASEYVTVTVFVMHRDQYAFKLNGKTLITDPVDVVIVEEPHIEHYREEFPAIIFIPEKYEKFRSKIKSMVFESAVREFRRFEQTLARILEDEHEVAEKVISTIQEIFKNYNRRLNFYKICG